MAISKATRTVSYPPGDPRSYSSDNCRPTPTGTNDVKSFFDGLSKISQLDILNKNPFLGRIGSGLRLLTQMSNSIRIGDSKPITDANGHTWTTNSFSGSGSQSAALSLLGINPNSLNSLRSFNPSAANGAEGTINNILDQVNAGNFSISQIPQYFTQLQQAAISISKIFSPSQAIREHICEPTPYAIALVGEYAPKYKFLFIVEFIFYPNFQNITKDGVNLAFLVNQSSQPGLSFDYQDINMYNFKTRVIKTASFKEMSMKFYDDSGNNVQRFYEHYMKLRSPITNVSDGAVYGPDVYGNTPIEKTGLISSGASAPGATTSHTPYGASIGVLPRTTRDNNLGLDVIHNSASQYKDIIQQINLYHVYGFGSQVTQYQMFNPRINELTFDDLDMSINGVTNLGITFRYDGLFVNNEIHAHDLKLGKFGGKTLPDLTSYGGVPGITPGIDASKFGPNAMASLHNKPLHA